MHYLNPCLLFIFNGTAMARHAQGLDCAGHCPGTAQARSRHGIRSHGMNAFFIIYDAAILLNFS
jgi:hypothetical protein